MSELARQEKYRCVHGTFHYKPINFYYRRNGKGKGFEKQLTAENGYILLGALASNYAVRFSGLPADPKARSEDQSVLMLFFVEGIEKFFFIEKEKRSQGTSTLLVYRQSCYPEP